MAPVTRATAASIVHAALVHVALAGSSDHGGQGEDFFDDGAYGNGPSPGGPSSGASSGPAGGDFAPCAGAMQQCGGGGGFSSYRGPTRCCEGYTCQVNSYYSGYSECMPVTTTTTVDPNAPTTTAPCAGAMQQCGGSAGFSSYKGPTTCCEGYACQVNSYYSGYSECMPVVATTTLDPDVPATTVRCAAAYASCEAEPCCGGLTCGYPSWSNKWYRGSKTCSAASALAEISPVQPGASALPLWATAACLALCAAVVTARRRLAARGLRRPLLEAAPLA